MKYLHRWTALGVASLFLASSVPYSGASSQAEIAQAANRGYWRTGQSVRVMRLSNSLAYDFSTIALNPSWPYLAVFHAEPYAKGVGCAGDSVAARYGSKAWSPIGPDVFGTHYQNRDMVVTRTPGYSEYMYSPDCGSVSGAANPILVYSMRNPANPGGTWALHWVSMRKENNLWRHYLMVAIMDARYMRNIFAGQIWGLGGPAPTCGYNVNCGELIGTQFSVETSGLLAWKDLPRLRPAHEDYTNRRIQSAIGYQNAYRTQGLLGTITSNADHTEYNFYYTDVVEEGGQLKYKILRRSYGIHLTHMGSPIGLKTLSATPKTSNQSADLDKLTYTPAVKVNYHIHARRYVVLYNCHDSNFRPDVCLQLSASVDLSDIHLDRFDSNVYGLRLYNDPVIPKDSNGHYYVGQMNIRKDGWGQHFTDGHGQVIVYVPVNAGAAPNPWNAGIYGKQVSIY